MLKIGWSVRDITPQRPAMVQGQMYRRIANSAKDPLTVTAMAIDGGDAENATVFVSCDLCYVTDSLVHRVREGLDISDLPKDNVILHATHTHTSLVIEEGWYDWPGPEVMSPAECEEWVAKHVTAAVEEAWRSRRPRWIGRSFDYAVVGHNRYAVYADGHAEMYGKTDSENFTHIEGYEDPSIDILSVWNEEQNLEGVALSIACPSQVDEHLSEFSADYWHDVRVALRERFGNPRLYVLPMYGAGGDQSPRTLVYRALEGETLQRREVTLRQDIGRRVADAVVHAVTASPPKLSDDPPLVHEVMRLELPRRRVSQADCDWAKARLYEWIQKKGETESWWPRGLLETVERFEGKRPSPPVPVELHVVRIDDMVIATNPFELFLDYGLQIKTRSAAAQTFIVSLANGMRLYLPTKRAVEAGGYGVTPAVSLVGPEGGELLVEETLRCIANLLP